MSNASSPQQTETAAPKGTAGPQQRSYRLRQAFSALVIFGIGLFENKVAGDIGYWVVAATVSLGGLCCAAVWLRHRSASALSRTSLWTLLALALVAIIAAAAVPDRMAGYFVLAGVGLLAAALLIPAASDALRLLAGLSLAGGGSVIAAPAVGELGCWGARNVGGRASPMIPGGR